MAPDRPDTSNDIEAAVGLASNQGVFGYCESFAFKEGDHATEFIETSVSSETIAEVSSEIKEDKEVKDEPSDDDLTSLSWLHQQNVLKTLEIPNTNKNSKDENVINNNFNEDSLDLSDENTNSVSDYDDTYSSVIDDKIANFSSAFQDVNGSHLINYASVIQENNFQSYTLSPNKQGKISTVNNNIINNNNNVSSVQRNKHPTHIPYDPQLHKNSKPPYSFSCLIFMAIEDSPVKALPVKEVYAWILQHFPYFRNAPTGWKNSVRHNLSLNKCFRKVEKSPNLGKGSLWMVDTQYRPNLMQALSRAPFPPPVIQTISPENTTRKTNTRLPDPVLFPYLSKRLASSNICENLDADFDSDVDAAAAAMLSFKHGPSIINNNNNKERKRKSQDSEKLVPIITRSCTEDHTYSLVTSVRLESKRCSNIENDSTDFDEQRKIAEGADALLNLAGVNTMHKELDPLDIPIKRKPKCNFENTPDKRRNRWREWNDNLRYIKQLRG